MHKQTSLKAVLFGRALRTTVLGVFAVLVGTASFLILTTTPIAAATSSTINFQARLQSSTGGIIADGNYNVEFKLYDASSSSGSSQGSCTGDVHCLWTETRTGADVVRVYNGYLTVNLGSVTAFPGTINWNQQLYLTMNIGGTGTPSWDGEMNPRLQLTAVPYAFQAGQLSTTNGANVATLSFTTPTATDSIVLPDASGTVCLQSSSSCGFVLGSGTGFLQGGNTFSGTTAGELGTNNNGVLNFRTNNTDKLQLDTSGNLQFQQASTLNIAQPASAGAGLQLTVKGGDGNGGTNVGGNLLLEGGAGVSTGAPGSVIVQANTNNSTSTFQLQNASSGVLLNADTTNMRISIDATYAAMSTPGTLTITVQSGGSLTATRTYRYKVTAIDAAGGETLPSTENSGTTTSSNKKIKVDWTAITGASGYKIYRTAANGATNTEVYLTTVLSNTFTDDGTYVAGTASVPSTATAYAATNVSNSSLQLTVGGNGRPTGQLYVSGTVPSTMLSSTKISGNFFDTIAVQGRYAYVGGSGDTLDVFDVANPAAPTKIGSGTADGDVYSLAVSGHYLYAIGFFNNLDVFDISNPAAPTLVSRLAITTSGAQIVVQGRYAYIADDSVWYIVDIANPKNPVIASSTTLSASAADFIAVQGKYVYIAGSFGTTLRIYDVSNPASPVAAGTASLSFISYFTVQGRYLYLADNSNNSLDIYDVSNPSSTPTLVGSATGMTGTRDVVVQGRYAYVVADGSNPYIVGVYDISDPRNPLLLGTASGSGNTVFDLAVSGRYLYTMAGASPILDVFDLGGAYIQQLETGGLEASSLSVTGNSILFGDETLQGGLTVAQSVGVNGNLGVGGQALFASGSASSSAFQIQNATSANVLNVDTSTSANLVTNGDFEVSDGTTGWTNKGASTTLTQDTTQQWQGNGSLKTFVNNTTASRGAQYSYSLATSTQYTLSLYAKVSSSTITDFVVGYHDNADRTCLTGQTLTTSWTRFTCTFTTTSSVSSGAIYVVRSGIVAETFFIDGVQLQTGAVATAFNAGGALQIGGIINSPLAIQNKSDSTTALQVLNASGSTLLRVDTVNSGVQVAGHGSFGAATVNPSSSSVLSLDDTIVPTTNSYGLLDNLRLNPSGSDANYHAGAYIQAQSLTGNAQNFTGGLRGGTIFVQHNGTGTLAQAWAGDFSVQNAAAGTITDARGVEVESATNSGGGAITTNYGLKVDDQTVGGTNYSIYTGAGQVRFGDATEIQKTSTTALQVQNGSAVSSLTVDTSGNVVTLGSSTTLVLGVKGTTDSINPGTTTCTTSGAVYYNSSDSQFRACRGGKLYNLLAGVDVQIFTAGTGTWTAPSGISVILVIACGGGGGGGGGGSATAGQNRSGGGGGGGGAYVQKMLYAADVSSSVAYTVAAATGNAASLAFGTTGGSTNFGPYVTAQGGGGGGQGRGNGTQAGGGGGGGAGQAGTVGGTTSAVAGGDTLSVLTSGGQGWAGGYGGNGSGAGVGGAAEYGGGGGGGSDASTGFAGGKGGNSYYGGGGGGGGGDLAAGNTQQAGGAGGGAGSAIGYSSGSGAAAGSAGANNGSSASNGDTNSCGNGGGGGGSNNNTGVNGGVGGNGGGGGIGGGGGGGGAGTGTATGGTGGAGGAGKLWVISW